MQAMTDSNATMLERVAYTSVVLNVAIASFLNGDMKEGVETFQQAVLELVRAAGLSEFRWVHVDRVGVHPANRDKFGLVPVDVHDLLLFIFEQGWSWFRVDALAGEIPPGSAGQELRDFNERLPAMSDGLLASTNPDMLDIVTVRGSHTTGAVRCS